MSGILLGINATDRFFPARSVQAPAPAYLAALSNPEFLWRKRLGITCRRIPEHSSGAAGEQMRKSIKFEDAACSMIQSYLPCKIINPRLRIQNSAICIANKII